jgi:hypothetical protein
MKKQILFLALILLMVPLLAQVKCIDKVYPTENKKSISKCCIKDIKAGNVVVYERKSILWNTEAVAVTLNGVFFELKENNDSLISKIPINTVPQGLYQGKDYNYYQETYKKAKNKLVGGVILSLVGGGLFVGGVVTVLNKINTYDSDESYNGVGIGMILFGCAGLGVGIPVAITGGVTRNKSKNAMLEIENQASLSFQVTNQGVSLVYKF